MRFNSIKRLKLFYGGLKLTIVITGLFLHNSMNAQNTDYGVGTGSGGNGNTSIGYYAGAYNIGDYNSFFGHNSGTKSQNGKFNLFSGAYSGFYASGEYNTSLGTQSGVFSEGNFNTFSGAYSGYNTLGDYNTFYGAYAGYHNKDGTQNHFSGYNSGYSNTSGSNNTFSGFESGFSNSSGIDNVFVGFRAGYSNTTGISNTFVGRQAGYFNTTASRNTFVGRQAGYENSTGTENTFIGWGAGPKNQQSNNTFIGSSSGASNINGTGNVFIGRQAGYWSEKGNQNVFIGNSAGHANDIGGINVYIGTQAGLSNDGNQNVFLGALAGQNTMGDRNVFIGHQAGQHVIDSDKLYIHNNADSVPLIYGDFVSKSVGLGSTNPGTYRLYVNGNAFASGLWIASDKRFKKNIKSIKGALELIKQLDGKSYHYKQENQTMHFPEGIQLGFLAQELKEVLPEAVMEHNDGSLAVSYTSIIPILTEAIKELDTKQEQYEESLQRIDNLEMQLSILEQKLGAIETDKIDLSTNANGIDARLQNIPNPAKGQTTIRFNKTEDMQDTRILVLDLQGKIVKSYDVSNTDRNELQISAADIGTGMFNYTLVANGVIVATNKMILE